MRFHIPITLIIFSFLAWLMFCLFIVLGKPLTLASEETIPLSWLVQVWIHNGVGVDPPIMHGIFSNRHVFVSCFPFTIYVRIVWVDFSCNGLFLMIINQITRNHIMCNVDDEMMIQFMPTYIITLTNLDIVIKYLMLCPWWKGHSPCMSIHTVMATC